MPPTSSRRRAAALAAFVLVLPAAAFAQEQSAPEPDFIPAEQAAPAEACAPAKPKGKGGAALKGLFAAANSLGVTSAVSAHVGARLNSQIYSGDTNSLKGRVMGSMAEKAMGAVSQVGQGAQDCAAEGQGGSYQ